MSILNPGKMDTKCLFRSNIDNSEHIIFSSEQTSKSNDYILALKHMNITETIDMSKIKFKEKKKIKPSGLILKLVGKL